MTIQAFLETLRPVADIRYKVSIVDFMTGSLEAFAYPNDDTADWTAFVQSITDVWREAKEVHLSTANSDDVIISVVVN